MGDRLDMSLMYAMHNALRRELDIMATITARVDDDPRRVLTGAVGWDIFKKALHIHHTAEDEALWPVLRQAAAGRADDLALLDAMDAEHAAIDPLVETIDAALADPEGGPERLAIAVDSLAVNLTGHLKHEEDQALPLIQDLLTLEQWQHYGRIHGAKTGPDGPLLTPWVLDGADEDTVNSMLAVLPEPVRAAYRNQWQPAYAALDRWNSKG
ncbi:MULTISPECIES: hemerythrin domain-containing protein [unclassified Streptomyces]|uniref:hemerythrin domain-containing protein n=1 Tax=unclassified Streptomyces TaxID=2593676 RepID=UPI00070E10FB|nr:hemerythrin domain-containing protein [Streptomyces sp. Root1310]KQX72248.1 hemerythrin [Streptomyces sp. Root1310]